MHGEKEERNDHKSKFKRSVKGVEDNETRVSAPPQVHVKECMESWVHLNIKMEQKSTENWSRNRADTLYYIGDVRQRWLTVIFILNERRKRGLKGWLKLRTLVLFFS